MPTDPQEFADLLGAKIIGEVPDVGGGPFGMARLARLMHQRLTPGQGERPGRPTDASWESRPKVPMSEETRVRLAQIAQQMSTPERQVSPMQVAAQLLEEAVSRVPLGKAGDAISSGSQVASAEDGTASSKEPVVPRGKGTGRRKAQTRSGSPTRRRKA
jgi:hypothetical protein